MTLVVNGAPRELRDRATVADLLEALGLNRNGVAVAVGGQVVPKTEHERRVLQPGEVVEVIRAVGGG